MKAALALVALMLVACGGGSNEDSTGSGGSGAFSGNAGSSGSGVGGWTSGDSGSGVGGSTPGDSSTAPSCCSTAADCATSTSGPPQQCIAGVCKEAPSSGSCWNEKDCAAGQGCVGAWVCPCGVDCPAVDKLGQCAAKPDCCSEDSDCPATSAGPATCVLGNCKGPLPPGACWNNQDCTAPSKCYGACVCPCGAVCYACNGLFGTCSVSPPPPPPPPGPCCGSDLQCSGGAVCAAGVCKQPVSGACWNDAECGPNATCEGEYICPCGAPCALTGSPPDHPGKCVPQP